MAGNVLEWCWNETGAQRYTLGGSWNDPEYMFTMANAAQPFERSEYTGFRCVQYGEKTQPLPEHLAPISVETIDVSHMGTAAPGGGEFGNRVFISGDLINPGEISLEYHFDPSEDVPIVVLAETITITFPTPAGEPSGAIWAFSGIVKTYSPAVPLDDKMVAGVIIQASGNVTQTAST